MLYIWSKFYIIRLRKINGSPRCGESATTLLDKPVVNVNFHENSYKIPVCSRITIKIKSYIRAFEKLAVTYLRTPGPKVKRLR